MILEFLPKDLVIKDIPCSDGETRECVNFRYGFSKEFIEEMKSAGVQKVLTVEVEEQETEE